MRSPVAVRYGATTIAGAQGQRQPSANELDGARFQVSSLRRPQETLPRLIEPPRSDTSIDGIALASAGAIAFSGRPIIVKLPIGTASMRHPHHVPELFSAAAHSWHCPGGGARQSRRSAEPI